MHHKLFSFLVAIFLLVGTFAPADTIIMKDGKQYDGKITIQTPDLVKIEIPVSDKIKETKTLLPSDIAQIIKTAPDDEAFAKIQELVPTPSLLTAEQYRNLIATGTRAFLSRHPGSKHQEKVEAMDMTLKEELDKVERGGIKIDNRWYTQEDQVKFKEQIEAQKILYSLKNFASGGRYDSLIPALRDFQRLEEDYFGTPAYAEGLAVAKEIIPSLGRQIKGLRQDVDVRNAKWEADKNALSAEQRFQVENARKQEDGRYAYLLAEDKKAKIKWTIVNPNSPSDLDAINNLTLSEFNRLKNLDPDSVKARAAALAEVDALIAAGNFDLAQAKLPSASAMPLVPPDPNNPQKRPSSPSTAKGKAYAAVLADKLKTKIAERKALEKAADEARKSAALAAKLEGNQPPPLSAGAATDPADNAGTFSAADIDSLVSRSAPPATPKAESNEKTKPKSVAPSKPKPKFSAEDDDDEETPVRKTTATTTRSSGGGFSLSPQLLIFGGVGVLAVVIVALKLLGIGGKKEE